jgi:hypothetical protein
MHLRLLVALLFLAAIVPVLAVGAAKSSDEEITEQKKGDNGNGSKAVLDELDDKKSCGGILKSECPATRRRLLLRSSQLPTRKFHSSRRQRQLVAPTPSPTLGFTTQKKGDTDFLDDVGGLSGAAKCLKETLNVAPAKDKKEGKKCIEQLNEIYEGLFPGKPKSPELTSAEIDALFAVAAQEVDVETNKDGDNKDQPSGGGGGGSAGTIIGGVAGAALVAGGLLYMEKKSGTGSMLISRISGRGDGAPASSSEVVLSDLVALEEYSYDSQRYPPSMGAANYPPTIDRRM